MFRRKDIEGFKPEPSATKLVLILHGWRDSPESMMAIQSAAKHHLGEAQTQTYVPDLHIPCFLSRKKAIDLVASLTSKLDQGIKERQKIGGDEGYREIIFVGHSFGAALARAVWTTAHGATSDGALTVGEAEPWAHLIKRLVLLAGTSRGWNPHSPVSVRIRVWSWFGDVIENLAGPRFLLLDIRRGAPFLTTMRLQSLEVRRKLENNNEKLPITVNILGTFDNIVAPADNIDLATGDESYHYLEVPNSGHDNILKLEDKDHGDARSHAFKIALTGSKDQLKGDKFAVAQAAIEEMVKDAQNDPGPQGSSASTDKAPDVKTVVFIVHGIRDYGFWTKRLARALKEQAGKAGEKERNSIHTITSSYGFFPMGPFLLPGERRKRVGWLLDQYVTARALYKEAESFHFVGHSNGTYLLAAALKECPAVRFKRVVLAGSVISPRYDWKSRIPAQVEKVVNYVAQADWVVATIPKGVHDLGISDLGDAGHSGFVETEGVVQVRYVPGTHSGALDPSRWDEIAAFLLKGLDPPRVPEALAKQQKPWVVFLGKIAFLIPVMTALLVVGGAVLLLIPLGSSTTGGYVTIPGWAWALALLAYTRIVSRIITRL